MATPVNSTDIIYATLVSRGNVLCQLRLSGFSSLAQLLAHIKRAVRGCVGLATLSVRNSTQGWMQNRSLLLSAV